MRYLILSDNFRRNVLCISHTTPDYLLKTRILMDFELIDSPGTISTVNAKLDNDLIERSRNHCDFICKSDSSVPFSVETGNGTLWYYLYSTIHDTKKIRKSVACVHNCRTCIANVSDLCSLFGEDGYAIDFKCKEYGKTYYNDVSNIRGENKHIQSRVFLVTKKNIAANPRYAGVNPDTREKFEHISLNLPKENITALNLSKSIPDEVISSVTNGCMDIRLAKILSLPITFADIMSTDINSDNRLFRVEFWERKVKYVLSIMKFASDLTDTESWADMTPIEKMHIRMFAAYQGNSFGNGNNLLFKETEHVLDCYDNFTTASGDPVAATIGFMNARSDPSTYMVRQVAHEIQRHAVKSRFKVSLAWEDKSDLDLWVVARPRGRIQSTIGYSNKRSTDGKICLDFDANAGTATDKPVENITFSDTYPCTYEIYVNNYAIRTHTKTIPFTLVIDLDGDVESITGDWPRGKGNNTRSDIQKMIHATTVNITHAILQGKNTAPEMSTKQANRFKELEGSFMDNFGDEITSKVAVAVNMPSYRAVKTQRKNVRSNKTMGVLSRMANKKTVQTKINGGMNEIIKNSTIGVQVRNFPPSYLTIPSCPDVIKSDYVANTYYEKYGAPMQPDKHASVDNCRLDNHWCRLTSSVMEVNGVITVEHDNYKGLFLVLDNMKLPSAYQSEWVLGGGMYPTDLKSDYHIYREMWQSHHTIVNPAVAMKNRTPAIGVFLHSGEKYTLIVNGVERVCEIP